MTQESGNYITVEGTIYERQYIAPDGIYELYVFQKKGGNQKRFARQSPNGSWVLGQRVPTKAVQRNDDQLLQWVR